MKTTLRPLMTLAPDINVTHTTKKFWGIYLYRVNISAPNCRIFAMCNTVDEFISHFKNRKNRKRRHCFPHEIHLLRWIFEMGKLPGCKLVVRDPQASLYFNNNVTLTKIMSTFPSGADPHAIHTVSTPYPNTVVHLDQNMQLFKKRPMYKFKIQLKDRCYPNSQQILAYVDSMGDDMFISQTQRAKLILSGQRNKVINKPIIYASSEAPILFLLLIAPGNIAFITEQRKV